MLWFVFKFISLLTCILSLLYLSTFYNRRRTFLFWSCLKQPEMHLSIYLLRLLWCLYVCILTRNTLFSRLVSFVFFFSCSIGIISQYIYTIRAYTTRDVLADIISGTIVQWKNIEEKNALDMKAAKFFQYYSYHQHTKKIKHLNTYVFYSHRAQTVLAF